MGHVTQISNRLIQVANDGQQQVCWQVCWHVGERPVGKGGVQQSLKCAADMSAWGARACCTAGWPGWLCPSLRAEQALCACCACLEQLRAAMDAEERWQQFVKERLEPRNAEENVFAWKCGRPTVHEPGGSCSFPSLERCLSCLRWMWLPELRTAFKLGLSNHGSQCASTLVEAKFLPSACY